MKGAAVNTLVQAGLNNALAASFLAVLVSCLGRPLARRPAVLHCLWFLVLLKLVSPPLYEISLPSIRPSQAVTEVVRSPFVVTIDPAEAAALVSSSESTAIASETSGPGWPGAWPTTVGLRAVGWIWLAGIITTFLVSAWRIRHFQLVLREATPASEKIQNRVDDPAAYLGVSRPPGP